MHNNCYLLRCTDTGDQVLIDAADDARAAARADRRRRPDHRGHHPPALGPPPRPRRGRRRRPAPTVVAGEPDADAITEQTGVAVDQRVGDGDRIAGRHLLAGGHPGRRSHARLDLPALRRRRPAARTCSPATRLFPGGVGNTQGDPDALRPADRRRLDQALRRRCPTRRGSTPATATTRPSASSARTSTSGASAAGEPSSAHPRTDSATEGPAPSRLARRTGRCRGRLQPRPGCRVAGVGLGPHTAPRTHARPRRCDPAEHRRGPDRRHARRRAALPAGRAKAPALGRDLHPRPQRGLAVLPGAGDPAHRQAGPQPSDHRQQRGEPRRVPGLRRTQRSPAAPAPVARQPRLPDGVDRQVPQRHSRAHALPPTRLDVLRGTGAKRLRLPFECLRHQRSVPGPTTATARCTRASCCSRACVPGHPAPGRSSCSTAHWLPTRPGPARWTARRRPSRRRSIATSTPRGSGRLPPSARSTCPTSRGGSRSTPRRSDPGPTPSTSRRGGSKPCSV